MNKILKSGRSNASKRDDLVKKAIMAQLSDGVKEIQYAGAEENRSNKTINAAEEANQLCTTIEAMFLHGLKDTLTHRFRKALSDVSERPVPSFWSPLLIISHKQTIVQITNLSQISTEVGQCRAWVRLALNDCLLSSYLMTVRQHSSSLKSYYRSEAFVCDSELLDVVQHLIEGVEAFKTFTLPFNSSLLNTWALPSLYLAGIWSPTLKKCPIAPCDDVAQTLDENSKNQVPDTGSDTASLSSAISFTSQSSGLRQIASLSEDEVLKIILAKDKKDHKEQGKATSIVEEVKCSESKPDQVKSGEDEDNVNYSVGNSLNGKTGWSFDDSNTNAESEDNRISKEATGELKETKSMETSYNALIESYNLLSGGYIRTPDIRELWQKFEDGRTERSGQVQVATSQEQNENRAEPDLSPSKAESLSLATQVGKIANEKGLDVQNFECVGCKQPLGISKIANVCNFTGDYFCDSCMSLDQVAIPARIIHNWDFKTYPVSQKSFNYINEIKDHPVIDFKVLNPFIYGVVEEMGHLQILRNQLNFLRAYLYTCREPVIEQLQKQMWPREYMYEHIHQYSISDLLDIPNNVLMQQLEKVVIFGKEHVFGCWLCSQKGFVCEVCNKPKALFPFDVENIYRCEICNAVFHKNCLNSSKPCPKCERKKKREELPLLGAVNT